MLLGKRKEKNRRISVVFKIVKNYFKKNEINNNNDSKLHS